MSNWGANVDALFNKGGQVSFASFIQATEQDKAAASTSLDKKFEQDRKEKWGLDGFKIEPKKRPNEPIKDDDSPCSRTIQHYEKLKTRWKLKGLELEGQTSQDEKLTDAQRCERFNSKASHGLTRLDYILTR